MNFSINLGPSLFRTMRRVRRETTVRMSGNKANADDGPFSVLIAKELILTLWVVFKAI